MKLKRTLSSLFILTVLTTAPSPAALAAKVDFSKATDKERERIEDLWDPLRGLSIAGDFTEVEPNDTCPGQALDCGSMLTQAQLTPGDVDFISFTATAGDVVILGTMSAGGFDPDTKITLLNSSCSTVLATDDDSGPGLFSRITYLVATSGTHILRIEGLHAGVTGDYMAYISCGPRVAGDICGTAPPLPCGSFSIEGTTTGTLNDYDLTDSVQNDCTSYATAGADLVYVIDQPEFTLTVTYTSSVDGALYLITDCSNPRGSCVAGSDYTVEGEPESITFSATGGGPYYLVLDNFLGGDGPSGDFTLTGFLDCPPARWVNVLGFTNSGAGLGAAWGDYDNDGKDDLYLTKFGEANRLMHNNGMGSLQTVSNPVLEDAGNGRCAIWGDADNDGDLDLYVVNAQGPNKMFQNDGGGSFTDITSPPLDDAGDGRSAAWADYDNDGDLDLYLVNAYTSNKLFQNDGTGGFTDVTSPPLDTIGLGTMASWADIDDDGDPDLYVVEHGGTNRLFRNDGEQGFVEVTGSPVNDPSDGRGAAWGDYDNDGDLDLYLSNSSAANKLFRNDGASGFVDVTSGGLGNGEESRGIEWGDFDNDGDLDLYLANDLGTNRLFENDGAGGFMDATSALLTDTNSGQAVASADYDGDGDLDLYLVNAFSFDKLFRNDPDTGNHWLQVDLQGTVSNRSAIGARVRVVAGGVSQIRDITGGSGYLAQGSLTAEFGLGASTLVDTLQIFWPSGIEQDSLNVTVDQRILMVEVDPAVDVEERPLPARLQILHNVPDPFNPSTQLRYVLPAASPVQVWIYDTRGRVVRHLFSGSRGPGLQVLHWNGTDDQGASLPSGTYVARIETAFGKGNEKLTLLK